MAIREIITFNSPWECRIGLTRKILTPLYNKDIFFQFPVGMSNRSYELINLHYIDHITIFQFPVGMSNRSYNKLALDLVTPDEIFQFPVGMSNRSYRLEWQVYINSY